MYYDTCKCLPFWKYFVSTQQNTNIWHGKLLFLVLQICVHLTRGPSRDSPELVLRKFCVPIDMMIPRVFEYIPEVNLLKFRRIFISGSKILAQLPECIPRGQSRCEKLKIFGAGSSGGILVVNNQNIHRSLRESCTKYLQLSKLLLKPNFTLINTSSRKHRTFINIPIPERLQSISHNLLIPYFVASWLWEV